MSLWHNETVSDNRNWQEWNQVYEFTLEEASR
jgi:hypothetical protein